MTDLQHLKLRSYVLLCHAVIEEYIENLGHNTALEARRLYLSDNTITKTLVALISAKVLGEIKEKKARKIGTDLAINLTVFSDQAFNQYVNVVTSNNGIKPDNLANIFLPLGVDAETVDFALVNALKALGEKRGDMAHKFAIQQELTLSSFETDLEAIERDILVLDEEACKCLAIRMNV